MNAKNTNILKQNVWNSPWSTLLMIFFTFIAIVILMLCRKIEIHDDSQIYTLTENPSCVTLVQFIRLMLAWISLMLGWTRHFNDAECPNFFICWSELVLWIVETPWILLLVYRSTLYILYDCFSFMWEKGNIFLLKNIVAVVLQ